MASQQPAGPNVAMSAPLTNRACSSLIWGHGRATKPPNPIHTLLNEMGLDPEERKTPAPRFRAAHSATNITSTHPPPLQKPSGHKPPPSTTTSGSRRPSLAPDSCERQRSFQPPQEVVLRTLLGVVGGAKNLPVLIGSFTESAPFLHHAGALGGCRHPSDISQQPRTARPEQSYDPPGQRADDKGCIG